MPFARIAPGDLRKVAIPALAVYALAWLPFAFIPAGNAMVRLQLAGTEQRAREVVSEWSPAEVVDVAFLLGVDAVHLLAYGVFLASASVWAGRRMSGRAAAWAPTVAWASLAASGFDALENVGMIAMIRGALDAPVPAVTAALAATKYLLLLVVLVYVLAAIPARSARRGEALP